MKLEWWRERGKQVINRYVQGSSNMELIGEGSKRCNIGVEVNRKIKRDRSGEMNTLITITTRLKKTCVALFNQ